MEQIERGNVKLDDTPALNQFILGALGAVPQVEGIAVTDPRALNRRWNGSSVEPLVEDWSGSPDIAAWLEAGASLTGPRWQAPFWTSTIESTILLLDTPIRVNGKFMGLFSQAVTISDLSRHIASVGTETGVIPFILHGRDHVLAHPLLISWAPSVTDQDQPLVTVEALGDPVLERIWTPDHRELYLLGGLTEASASGVAVGDDYYVFLYRDIDLYGPEPWTIGAYVNSGTSDVGEWLAEIVRSALSGSFTRSGTMEGNEFERVIASVVAGFAVLVLSVALAAWLGARASRPVRALATAARSIEARGLNAVAPLQRSRVAEFDDANRSFNRMVAGLKESELVRETLGRFVPTDVAKTLLTEGGELAPRQAQATVLFCDLEGFTGLTENLGPDGIVELLNEYFEVMVEVLERHRGVVTQFQGDAILATFNVPVPDPDHAANALRAAIEMQEATRRRAFAGQRIGNRIGVNTGPLVAGAVGAKGRLSYTVHGDAVNLAAPARSAQQGARNPHPGLRGDGGAGGRVRSGPDGRGRRPRPDGARPDPCAPQRGRLTTDEALGVGEPERAVVVALDVVSALVHETMVRRAEQDEIVKRGLSTLGPVSEVVAVQTLGGRAAGETASAVSVRERAAYRGWDAAGAESQRAQDIAPCARPWCRPGRVPAGAHRRRGRHGSEGRRRAGALELRRLDRRLADYAEAPLERAPHRGREVRLRQDAAQGARTGSRGASLFPQLRGHRGARRRP